MKRIAATSIAATALALVTGAASAADIARPVYKAAPAAAPFSWTGLYIGGHAGYGWSDANGSITSNTFIDTRALNFSNDGVVGGAQIGYNWHFAPNWVAGVEADISGTGITGTQHLAITSGGFPLGTISHYARHDIDWLASLRARFGYAWDRSLVYVTGGFAWAGLDTDGTTVSGLSFSASAKDTVSGWTLGAGYELAFAPNWSARVEYLHYDLDGMSRVVPSVPATAFVTTTAFDRTKVDVVRLGVNYRFGDAAPLAAPVHKAPAAFTWTGLYFGGHAGYGWSDSSTSIFPTLGAVFDPQVFSMKNDGVVAGAQLGYNWHFAPQWLAGIEADFSGTGINGSEFALGTINGAQVPGLAHSAGQDVEWLATLRGRLGYTWDRSLLYVTGGFAWAKVSSDVLTNAPALSWSGAFSDTVAGWVLGGGYEWAFAPNWSARIEYLHYDLDSISNTFAATPAFPLSATATSDRTTLDVVRAGVNYRFGAY